MTYQDETIQHFVHLLAEHHLTISDKQIAQFESYYEELIAWNKKMNLTAITDREQVYMKHFYDSVSLSFFVSLPSVHRLVDIGSGAGFPALPLKIMFPHLHILIVDSLNKRIQFLQHVVDKLGLENVICLHSRAEDAARNATFREQFDLSTARAVARLNVLGELCLPFIKTGGLFIAMKGVDPQEEVIEAEYCFGEMGARLQRVAPFKLPVDHSQRHFVIVHKTQSTPKKYPRKPGMVSKNPITPPHLR